MHLGKCVMGSLLTTLVGPAGIAATDPYKPLELYGGRWSVVTSRDKTVAVVNTCSRTGLFFVCEQSIDGAPKALVVFLPRASDETGQTYRIQTLGVGGAAPGPWFSLKIKDADWVYSPEGAEPRERTLNHFLDADHIHFDLQKKSGDSWKTTLSGDETRVK